MSLAWVTAMLMITNWFKQGARCVFRQARRDAKLRSDTYVAYSFLQHSVGYGEEQSITSSMSAELAGQYARQCRAVRTQFLERQEAFEELHQNIGKMRCWRKMTPAQRQEYEQFRGLFDKLGRIMSQLKADAREDVTPYSVAVLTERLNECETKFRNDTAGLLTDKQAQNFRDCVLAAMEWVLDPDRAAARRLVDNFVQQCQQEARAIRRRAETARVVRQADSSFGWFAAAA